MSAQMVIVVSVKWVRSDQKTKKRVEQGSFPFPSSQKHLVNTQLFVRARNASGSIVMEEATVKEIGGDLFIKSNLLHALVRTAEDTSFLLLFIESTPRAARIVAVAAASELLELLVHSDPPIRAEAFGLPPTTFSVVQADDVLFELQRMCEEEDRELFNPDSEQFLRSPHILVPLFAHVLALSSKENLDFPVILKTVAEQLRVLLTNGQGNFQIGTIARNHQRLWHEVLGEKIAFLDGGVARISGLPSTEPLALRVGIYRVCPGETDLSQREEWTLAPYVLGDIMCPVDAGAVDREPPDAKRLLEAGRYVLEPLTALNYLKKYPDTLALLIHGPLVNQFTQYDEGEPNYLPALDPHFLESFGIDEVSTREMMRGIPVSEARNLMWNQFMAVYGVVTQRVDRHTVPIVGVIERSAGRAISKAVLKRLVNENQINESTAIKIERLIDQYSISDDFLFGCILREGEFLPPISIQKNFVRRARERWQEVVAQYPCVEATILKSSSASFPFRVEMNAAAVSQMERILNLLYHTSRLLPRYAFPVGLDIADKYAKIPDWLARGVSARLSADVLRRALATGDPNIVAQIRQFLARSPRDFFYRPQT